MTTDPHRQGDMAHDTSRAVVYAYERRLGGDGARWAALEESARTISCWAFGHPAQPRRFLGRFEQRPWRCVRCGTWWVTKHEVDYPTYSGGEWRWHRVYQDESGDAS